MKEQSASIAEDQLGNGEQCSFIINGRDVLLCKVADRYYAVANRCSHALQPLSEGRLKGYEISCPLHGAKFDIRNGECLAAPAISPIPVFPVTLEEGKVIVHTQL